MFFCKTSSNANSSYPERSPRRCWFWRLCDAIKCLNAFASSLEMKTGCWCVIGRAKNMVRIARCRRQQIELGTDFDTYHHRLCWMSNSAHRQPDVTITVCPTLRSSGALQMSFSSQVELSKATWKCIQREVPARQWPKPDDDGRISHWLSQIFWEKGGGFYVRRHTST